MMREFLWFGEGELGEIFAKLTALKFGYDATWEATALLPIGLGIALAFLFSVWVGL